MSMKTAEYFADEINRVLPLLMEPIKASTIVNVVKQIQSDAYQAGVEANNAPSKSVEEWLKLLEFARITDRYVIEDNPYKEERIKVINQIFQSGKKEGWKDGAKDAAEIGYKESTANANPHSRSTGTMLLLSTAGIYRKAILTAIKNKEK